MTSGSIDRPKAWLPAAWHQPLLTLVLTLACLYAMTADTLVSMVTVWEAATTYHHCFLVLPIAIYLFWRKRKELSGQRPIQASLAFIPLIGFAFLWLIGRAGQIQLFEHIAVVGMTVSLTIALLGWRVAGIIAFPLGFLFFLVPAGDGLVPPLQQFTANFSVALLRLVDIPVFHDGIMIETPSGLFEVAEACAGIRFLIANIMIGALFAHLAMSRSSRWAAFMALSIIIPIIANGLRAFGIILIAYLTDNEYAAGVDHIVYGWGFFALVMLLFLAIGNMMADWPEPEKAATEGSKPTVAKSHWRPAFALPLALIVMAGPLYARAILERNSDAVAIDPKLMLDPTLALDLGPICKTDHQSSKSWRPRFDRADMTQGLIIDCGGKPVDLFLAYYAFERDGVELIHHGNRLADGEAWTRIDASWHASKIDGLPNLLRAEDLYGREAGDRLVLAWYWIGGKLLAKDWQAKAYQLYRRLLGDDGPVALIALSAAYDDHPTEALPDIEEVLIHHKGIADYLSILAAPD